MPVDHVLTWDETAGLVNENTPESLAKLGRTVEQLKVYRAFIDKLKQEYDSVADYLLINIFETPVHLNPEGRKHAVDREHKQFKLVWRPNDFPYNYEAGMGHWVMWCSEPLPAERIQREVDAKFPDLETMWFVNPELLQSVKGIWHVHVMTRPRQDGAPGPQ